MLQDGMHGLWLDYPVVLQDLGQPSLSLCSSRRLPAWLLSALQP